MAYLFIIGVAVLCLVLLKSWGTRNWKKPSKSFPTSWRKILHEHVTYYRALSKNDQKLFEFKVQEFLLNHRVTGIKTTVTDADKILVASSAIIPIFHFPEWRYGNLFEVLLYPNQFNDRFETAGDEGRNILGMVGTGYMEGKMILSQQALRHGFTNASDKRNTAIHEFVHLIDKADGTIDGIPKTLLDNQYTLPWIDLIRQKIDEIREEDSDINAYGGTSTEEFLPVASEYFFERPKLMAQKHPQLYALLEKMFRQEMDQRPLHRKTQRIGRNSPCPCGSGEKFKNCCDK